jgi:uncharacterized membrane protein YhaH (DUF805 family)
VADKQSLTTEERAQRRAKYLTGLIWHLGTFLIINAFFWLLDILVGQNGVQWAFWITLFWGLALLFHALAWFIDGRQLERRRAQLYLEDEGRTVH